MKNKRLVVAVSASVLAVMMVLAFVIQQNPTAFLVFAVGSTPDSYGNKIRQAWIAQVRAEGTWSTTVDYSSYSSGMTIDIIANYQTWILVAVNLNTALCPGGPGDAKDLTRAYLSVSGVKSNELMTWVQTDIIDSGFYTVTWNSTAWTPASGVTYTVTLNYQAYY